MTTAQNMSIYHGFAGNRAAAKSGNLKARMKNYFLENQWIFLSAIASMSGSSYAFNRYVLPELQK